MPRLWVHWSKFEHHRFRKLCQSTLEVEERKGAPVAAWLLGRGHSAVFTWPSSYPDAPAYSPSWAQRLGQVSRGDGERNETNFKECCFWVPTQHSSTPGWCISGLWGQMAGWQHLMHDPQAPLTPLPWQLSHLPPQHLPRMNRESSDKQTVCWL